RAAVTLLFEPIALRGLELPNRIVVSPMCQYSATPEGCATDWHFVHLGSRAVGGAALIFVEATAVESRGRLSLADWGLWDDAQIEGLARIVRFAHEQGAKIGIQLAHGGRKAFQGSAIAAEGVTRGHGPSEIVGPSALAFEDGWAVPHELAVDEIGQ